MDFTPYLIGALAGGVLAYLLFYLFSKSSHVSRKDHEKLSSQWNDSQTQLRMSEDRLKTQQELASSFRQKAEDREKELNSLLSRTATLEAMQQANTERLKELGQSLAEKYETDKKQQAEINHHQRLVAELQAQNFSLNEKLANQKLDLAEMQRKAHLEFEKLAQQIFEEKSGKFTETNKANIEAILKPLHENLDTFRKKVEETYDKESKERFSLEKEVKNLVETSARISQEANNLTTALKGQIKKQGDWGETILERILEMSGLVKDREYFIQESMKGEEGNTLRPDVIVRLPDDRNIIIDSKVSLNAYLRFSESDIKEQQDIFIAQHLTSIYQHVDMLSAKKYNERPNSLDYTIMFIPIEPAYILAVQSDPNLWGAAYAKKVVMISPSTLIATLKIVADLWKREQQNKNAIEIANQGTRLHEKFVGFVESLLEVGKHITRSQDFYIKAMGQLRDGRGNLVDQAEKLRKLGIKSSKQLPPGWSSSDYEDDDSGQKEDTAGEDHPVPQK